MLALVATGHDQRHSKIGQIPYQEEEMLTGTVVEEVAAGQVR